MPNVAHYWDLTLYSVQVFGTGEGGDRRVSSGDRHHKRQRRKNKRPVLPIKRNHAKKWQNKKRPPKKLRKEKLPRPSRPPPPHLYKPFPPHEAGKHPVANQNKTPALNTKTTAESNSTYEDISTPTSYNTWSTTELPKIKDSKKTKKPFTAKPKKPFKFKSRSKQKEATALRGKLVHSIIHQDKSLEKEIYKTLEASLEKKEEVTTERSSSSWQVPSSNAPFYPTIASKLVEMPDPVPTAATETESPGVTDHSRGLTTGKKADGSYSADGLRRSMKNRGRVQSPLKKFKKFNSMKKRRPINGAFGAKVEPPTPSADHLTAPLESKESEETENPMRRQTNVSPEYGDSFVINYNDQEIKIKPSIVYDTSHSTGSIIKELFSDQLGARNYQTVREASNYFPSSSSSSSNYSPTSFTGSTPRPSYHSKPTPSRQAVSRNFQTIQEPSSFTPSPPYRAPTTSPNKPTPYYEEKTPRPSFGGPTPTNYRDEALASYTPTPHRRRDRLPTYSATPAPNDENSQELQDWHNAPVYVPTPQETTNPKHPRVKKQSAPSADETCDCLNVPLSPACSLQCPNIASDRQGFGPQVPIVSQAQEHNQDPAQSHAFE